MKTLLVGLGSIGRRHLANLRTLDPTGLITVCHQYTRPHEAGEGPKAADRVVYSLEDGLNPLPDMALITGPSPLHISTAEALAQKGVHLFIEKPLSHRLDGVKKFLDLCRERRVVVQVGYNFRFYEPFVALRRALNEGKIGRVLNITAEVGQYLPDWRPGTDYRRNVTARSDLGGGVLLELSHEIDYVRWLVGEVAAVSAQVARVSDLEIDVEDTAEVTLKFENGALGHIHLDFIQRGYARSCRIIGSEGTIRWDSQDNRVRLFSAASKTWSDIFPSSPLDRNVMYVEELKHFLKCVAEDRAPAVGGEEGLRVMEIVMAARKSSEAGQVVSL